LLEFTKALQQSRQLLPPLGKRRIGRARLRILSLGRSVGNRSNVPAHTAEKWERLRSTSTIAITHRTKPSQLMYSSCLAKALDPRLVGSSARGQLFWIVGTALLDAVISNSGDGNSRWVFGSKRHTRHQYENLNSQSDSRCFWRSLTPRRQRR
jgi:hypothetical protein